MNCKTNTGNHIQLQGSLLSLIQKISHYNMSLSELRKYFQMLQNSMCDFQNQLNNGNLSEQFQNSQNIFSSNLLDTLIGISKRHKNVLPSHYASFSSESTQGSASVAIHHLDIPSLGERNVAAIQGVRHLILDPDIAVPRIKHCQ